jgi:hypothetical protein
VPLAGPSAFAVHGEHVALLEWPDEAAARLTIGAGCVVTFPGADGADFRVHRGVATVWTPDGRVAAADLVTGDVLANVRTR